MENYKTKKFYSTNRNWGSVNNNSINIIILYTHYWWGEKNEKLTFGIVTDVYKDLIPAADERLEAFINKANERKVDFII